MYKIAKTNSTPSSFFQSVDNIRPLLPVLDLPNNKAVNSNDDLSELDSLIPVSNIEPLPVLELPNNNAVNSNDDLSELFTNTP